MKNKGMKKRLLAMAVGIGILGMAGAGFAALEVQAAEPPAIADLKVTESGDGQGIVAQCSYRDYSDQSGCEMTLYLYRKEDSGQISVLLRRKIPFAASGSVSTDVYKASEGIYFASVGTNFGGEVMQTYSQSYYRVKIEDGKVEVTEITENAGEPNAGSADRLKPDKEKAKGTRCRHNLAYELERQATAKQDSLLAYQCTICGDVADYMEVPNSAYCVFLKESAEKIQNAGTDEVVIDTDRWMSFDRTVLEALAGRRDVTVSLYYQYQGQRHYVGIPAGEDVSGLEDENGYCGFLYLMQVFGGGEQAEAS